MDIPDYPGQTKDVTQGKQIQLQQTAPVPLEQLHLTPGKSVNAVVTAVFSKPDNLPGTVSLQTNASATDGTTDWLLKINGKPLLVSTDIPLRIGQLLTVIPGPERPGQAHELLIQQTAPAGNAATSALASNKLDSNSISILLRAINQVLPRQVSVEHGLSELMRAASGNTGNPVNLQAKNIMQILLKHVPQLPPPASAEDRTKPASGMPLPSARTSSASASNGGPTTQEGLSPIHSLKHPLEQQTTNRTDILAQAIRNSGLFFEQGISRGAIQPGSLAADISDFQRAIVNQTHSINSLSPDALAAGKQPPGANISGSIVTGTPASQNMNAKAANLLASFGNALNISSDNSLKQLQTGQKTTPDTTRISATSDLTVPAEIKPVVNTTNTDLKALLYKITAALTRLTSINTGKPEATYLDALTQAELLKTPFNFPHLTMDPNQNSILKASAILADQELTTGQLLKLIAGMLNRIQFNQLNGLYQSHSSSSETATVNSWFMELPVINQAQGINIFNLRIDQEQQNSSPEKHDKTGTQIVWRIALSFDLDSLGPVYVQAVLSKSSISSTIWADRTETLALINQETPYFRQRLAQTGLDVGDICCQRGAPKQNKTKLEQGLVDIKA